MSRSSGGDTSRLTTLPSPHISKRMNEHRRAVLVQVIRPGRTGGVRTPTAANPATELTSAERSAWECLMPPTVRRAQGSAVIRSYRDGDLDDVLDVWYQASLIAHSFLGEEFLAAEREEIAEHWLPIADTIVCEIEGCVVGFVALIGNTVGAIFVSPTHQRSGIGRALMNRARMSRPFLELDVFEANASARRFYEAYGFEQVSRHLHVPTGHTELHLRLG